MNIQKDKTKFVDIAVMWTLIFIYAFLIMYVWNWFSSFVNVPKMEYWVALAIYLLLARVVRKGD